MKLFRKITALSLVLLMLLAMAGCTETPPAETTTEPETTVDTTQEDLTALYLAAIEKNNGQDMAWTVSSQKTVTVNGQVYSEKTMSTVDCWGLGTEELLAKASHTVSFGEDDYSFIYKELYHQGKLYHTYNSDKFYEEMTAEDFTQLLTPMQMLTPSVYTLAANEDNSKITFSDATTAEEWLVPEDVQLLCAEGTATLDTDGSLKSTVYSVSYLIGGTQVDYTYVVTMAQLGRQPAAPEKPEEYKQVEDLNGIYAMEHAYGYLIQAQQIAMSNRTLTVSAAGAISVIENTTVDAYHQDDTYMGRCQSFVNYNNYSSNENVIQERDEKMIDGKYTVSVDDGRAESNSSVKEETFQDAVVRMSTENIIRLEMVDTVTCTDLGNTLLFEYTGTEEMALSTCEIICQTWFGNATVLEELASKYETNTMTFYIALDRYSLLPTAAGQKYEGTHTIQRQKCPISYQSDQSFDLGHLDAYKAITEEAPEEIQPETGATPLFYKVTGENGQQMWLLGTIHIGDNRTAYLPQAIYDALNGADALAIECNTEAFSDQVDEDEKLQEQLSECYYYTDGTSMQKHIVTEDLYEDAVRFLKASGNYDFNCEALKPYFWSSAIDNFSLRQGYTLSSEKGVEMRLLDIAEKEEIPVWEVESNLFQMQMLSGFSDNLQEFLLFSAMVSGGQSNWESSWELYEMWCQGDEAALIEKLADSPWEFTEDDFDLEDLEGEDLEKAQAILGDLENINAELSKLQQEYNKAMSIDRNAGMLEVAKEYLESGDVVFYAVGLAHLLAEDGLVNTLREAGYTVELVQYQ